MVKDPFTSEITELKKKLEDDPDSLLFAPLADAFRKEGSLDEALRTCKSGLEKHPSYTSALVVLGRIYQEQGKHEEAVEEFKKVLDLEPENLMAHLFLGAIYMEKKDFQTAIEEFQKILSLNPDDEETQNSLKQAIEKAAGEQKAKETAPPPKATPEKKADKKESTASITIAELYLKQGHFDKAIEVFQELLANDPQNLMLRQKLSEAVEKQKKENAVEGSAQKIKKNEFTQPPDQKEDVLVEEAKIEIKKQGKNKKETDFKFTSDDILQVMRRGGKDDAVVEEKKIAEPVHKDPAPPENPVPVPAKKEEAESFSAEKIETFKGVLAELSVAEGIIRSILMDVNGNTIVSMGETSNNEDLGKQTLAIIQNTHRSVDHLHQGKLQQIFITAELGHILLVSLADVVLIVLAGVKTNLGLLRLALDSAIKKLEKIV